jgi:toxin ParE1/3/4
VPSVRYTVRARRDLLDIWLEVADSNPPAADELYNRLEARIKLLKRFPRSGPLRPDIAIGARALVELPYLILYRVTPQGAQIVRVLHGSRNIDKTLFGEGVE